ncbi:BT4734/BF3469 family protein [uncultured Bacteroides sp.]|uniref:BT4734/BF3469 family protein n=1 Tax=uncultured Bacteroides sp. TaxID=162156 RepID=UPI002AAB1B87|nr:BT4734/BF3469 family protein [uncultured Bacteroides sp.]
MNITQIRSYGEKKTQRMVKLAALLDSMQNDTNEQSVLTMRHSLQVCGDTERNIYAKKLPQLLFAAAFKKENETQVMKEYNGLVLLEVNNLSGMDEAANVRHLASEFPQTLAAFIGSTGKSVKILVPFTLPDGSLPQTYREAELFHAHAYRLAVRLYQPQIPYSIALNKPTLEHCCRFSYDPELYFAPHAHAIQQKQPTDMPAETTYQEAVQEESNPLQRLIPGYERNRAISTLFETSLNAALSETSGLSNEEGVKPLLVALANNSFKSGIPEEEVVNGAILHLDLKDQEVEVRQTIHNAYLIGKNFGGKPCIRPEQTMAMKADEFMKRRYEFRYNTQTTEVEYRERNTFFFDFRPITDRALNSIALNAQFEGLQLWDRDVKRYVYSDRVPLFSPIEHYLSALPKWDGKDRIRTFANAVPCDNPHWADFFHRWFLCMTAHWRGTDKKYANSTSPLLVGPQGYGKSTFCLNILPPQLRTYYTDSIDFSKKRDAELSLNRFALINIDEFDQVSASNQAFLKHILQKPVVNTRKPHKTAVQELRRYASFIATSNHADLLTDKSGGRRFICILLTGKIDDTQVINHEQLYAQAISEIQSGERYWFNADDEAILMKKNQEFEQTPAAEQLFQQYYRTSAAGEESQKLLAVEIFTQLQKKSGIKLTATNAIHFGRILRKLNIPNRRINGNTYYDVAECQNLVADSPVL